VRHKGLLVTTQAPHADSFTIQTACAYLRCVCATFFAALAFLRELRNNGPEREAATKPPADGYFRIDYKRSALSRPRGMLRICSGFFHCRGKRPLLLPWSGTVCPQTVLRSLYGSHYKPLPRIHRWHWPDHARNDGSQIIKLVEHNRAQGIDLVRSTPRDRSHEGITPKSSMDGLRSKAQYQNNLKADLDGRIARQIKAPPSDAQAHPTKQNN